jgi:uncharacterized protein (TIGR03546 family)
MIFLNKAWISLKGTVKGFDSPRQLAMGVAFGMMIGLIPKDSLLPYMLTLIALLTPSNLACLGITGFAFHALGPKLDPVLQQIGNWFLSLDVLTPYWQQIFDYSISSWMRIENTVVMGAFLLGLAAFGPFFLISKFAFAKFGAKAHQFLAQTRLARWLVGSNQTPNLQKS